MKKTLLALTCMSLLAGAVGAQAQDRGYFSYARNGGTSGSNSGFVGDDSFVGDYGDADAPSVVTDSFVGDMDGGDSVETPSQVDPVPMPEPASTSHAVSSSHSTYPTTTYATAPTFSKSYCPPAANKWLRAETLLWFMQERDTPPLVEVGPGPGLDPRDVTYGDPIQTGLAPGFRLDYGHYFGQGDLGIGARVWGLFGEDDDYTASDLAGNSVIVRPFFDTTRLGGPGPNQLIVSGIGGTAGSFTAESEFDFIATEVYGRVKFEQSPNYRIDLIGGYSYFGLDDTLALSSTSVQAGNQFDYNDLFEAENRFYGGQIGLETMISKGRWSLTSLSKVHLGNMHQQVRLDGNSQSAVFPFPPGPVGLAADQNGFYIQGQEGLYENDEFAFVPEMNIRLGYSPRDQVHFTVGYTFAYWSTVALAGEQINPVIDGQELAAFGNNPGTQSIGYAIEETDFWMQGIDLGVTFTY